MWVLERETHYFLRGRGRTALLTSSTVPSVRRDWGPHAVKNMKPRKT